MPKNTAADPSDVVTIEILPEPKSASRHAGRELKPGERVEMKRKQAQRHVDAGNARIVES